MFVFRGKNVVGSFLPSVSINVPVLYFLKNLFCKGCHNISVANVFMISVPHLN